MPFLFLAELQNWLVFNAVPVENWALVMAQCLRGPAATWFTQTMATWTEKKQKPVCRTVKEAFLRRFVGQNWQTQMRTCMTKLKYANSVEDYVNKVQMLNLYLDDRTDADRIHHFVERLPHTVQRHVRQQHPTTFQEHLDAALTFETPAELSVEQLLGAGVAGVRPNDRPPLSNDHGAPTSTPRQHVGFAEPPPPRSDAMDVDAVVKLMAAFLRTDRARTPPSRSNTPPPPDTMRGARNTMRREPGSSGEVCRNCRDWGKCKFGAKCYHKHVGGN
jgi:hypothetical protein